MSDLHFKKPGLMSRRIILGTTIGGGVAFFIFGILFWGGFNTAMEATNQMDFCISCHEMEENVFQEYKPTIHYSNRTGVRATCPDCHVPRPWIHKMVRKIQASNEVFHKIMGTVDTPEKFDQHRLTMAKRVWNAMKNTDSRECRNCHNFESMNPEFQRPRARKQHLNAFETGQTCIDCHKGIAHKSVRKLLSDEELEQLEKPDPRYVRQIPEMYKIGLERVEAKEAEMAANEQAEKEKERAARQAAKAAEKVRIEQAVDAALQNYKAQMSGAAVAAAAGAGAARGYGIDWDGVPSRQVTIFYPGETSMEWVLTGKDHGGARPLTIGGRMFTVALLVAGVAFIAYGLEYLLTANLGDTWRERRMMRTIENLENHVILCGYGRVGQSAITSLKNSKRQVVVLEKDVEKTAVLEENNLLYLIGDATKDELLQQAGIDRAWGLLICTGDDSRNLFIVLSARALNSDLYIVTRSVDAENERKMRRAGANRVVSPYQIGGQHMANIVIRPHVTDFFDVVTLDGGIELWVEELVISETSPLIGKAVGQANIRQETGVSIIAMWREGRSTIPDAHTILQANDELIVIGTRDQLAKMEKLTGIEVGQL